MGQAEHGDPVQHHPKNFEQFYQNHRGDDRSHDFAWEWEASLQQKDQRKAADEARAGVDVETKLV